MTPPFRADHVGSLLRPAALKQAFRDHGAGHIDDSTFDRIQDEAIRDRLGISLQCGFASTVAGNPLSEADMRAKLARCVEVASAVWG